MSKKGSKEEQQALENREWLDSLNWVIQNNKPERVQDLLYLLQNEAQKQGIASKQPFNTPYLNTIPPSEEKAYPGDQDLEEKLLALIRWNAMAMVVRANKTEEGIGGHLSTYNSIAELFEVGFNHFFKVHEEGKSDIIYFQGHAAPGVYARAFLEGRLTEKHLQYFRRELQSDKGISSYPHPWLMENFWNVPTVSMGLAAIMSLYQARFNKYLENRKIIESNPQKIWAFLGDGEMDEPESRGAIAIAAREKLDNLIYVINCNLQRLDGPVSGNGKIVQELEANFKGAGWNVIKVLWGQDWDPLFEKDKSGLLAKKLTEIVDGQLQNFAYSDGSKIREELFEQDEELQKLVKNLSDQELKNLTRGGHDLQKIFNAYRAAIMHKGQPTVILAQTIKGYGQGDAGEASNVSHQQKKLKPEALKHFRDHFKVPVSDKEIEDVPFLHPNKDSKEIKYLQERRKKLGGFIPERKDLSKPLDMPDEKVFADFYKGSGEEEATTTSVLVRIVSKLLKDKNTEKLIIPIIPDESRTFGIEALFRQSGIYAAEGQQYDPVDSESLLYYRESKEGAILEEGITEAGCMSSFNAAGTAYSVHGLNTIPFFFFYSMFGFQRIGDLIWAAADAKARGFLIGGISGRSSMPGEGLQHQDGQSQLYAYAFPNLMAYDPAFAYEAAVIVKEGIRRMYAEKENIFYYLTVTNDTYPMPKMPKDSQEGILKGMYRYQKSKRKKGPKVHLFGSGALITQVMEAATVLEKDYEITVDIWSITSYKALYDDAIDTARKNLLNAQLVPSPNYIQQCLEKEEGVFVAACDYLKALPASIAQWFPRHPICLGTDGFGRSDNRESLRDFFEVDFRQIAYAAMFDLAQKGDVEAKTLKKAAKDLEIDSEKINPRTS
ncbi:pyruvate dehydrogenase (acetyl-transferring), homodimeric type [Litoribacter populi]|uniref:pyruvate dehydrogenase (acetyl-transferring), homodimeric type n=1 Tax=Litoribacter populi TaxID=2598460 RepID=UPI00117F9F71|nr:pyruvate dehydrogenase (acetyl-transferring), homodimeric type [Litoribacter populi]